VNGAELLAESLKTESVEKVFGLPGLQLDPAMNAMYQVRDDMDFVAVRHEQSATYMADGYARVTGRPGVAMVVPGPGVLNAGAGLATAYACSSPVLLLSGSIESQMIGRGLGALHEIPGQSELLSSLTKWSARARHPDEIPELVHEAFYQMQSGQPQPVALEVPPDVLRAAGSVSAGAPRSPRKTVPEPASITAVLELLKSAKRPIIYAGGGVIAADAGESVLRLAELLEIPVVLTRNGRGAMDSRHRLVFDQLSLRQFSQSADLVLAIGTRLGSGDGGHAEIGRGELVMVNVDERTFRYPRPENLRVHADAALAADALAEGIRSAPESFTVSDWSSSLSQIRSRLADHYRDIAPQVAYLEAIRSSMPDDGILVSEYTQVGYAASMVYPVHRARTFISPGYQGTLGYGFATALGAQVGAGSRPVVSITGDGGFSWTLSELSTAKKYNLPLTVVVFNDGYYFNVRRMQQEDFDSQFIATDLCNPDYVALAKSFGIDAHRVDGADELATQLAQSVDSARPTLIEAPVGEFPSIWDLIDN
jgi:acetolactate synthase I/II/III large subunit